MKIKKSNVEKKSTKFTSFPLLGDRKMTRQNKEKHSLYFLNFITFFAVTMYKKKLQNSLIAYTFSWHYKSKHDD